MERARYVVEGPFGVSKTTLARPLVEELCSRLSRFDREFGPG